MQLSVFTKDEPVVSVFPEKTGHLRKGAGRR
jgi:hypothetical protein